jgi:MFS family permease
VSMAGESGEFDRRGYTLLGLMFATYLIDSFFRAAPSALSNALIGEFDLSYTDAGLVMSIYTLPYALMQVPSGLLSDRWGVRRTTLAFLALSLLGNLAFWGAREFETLLLSQLVMGFGSSIIYINSIKLIEALLPAERLARSLGVLSAASPLGSFVALAGLPYFYSTLNVWRPAYLAATLALLLILALNAVHIHDPPNFASHGSVSTGGALEMLRSLAGYKVLTPLFVGYTISGLNWSFWSWMPKFLIDVKGFNYVEAGFLTSVPTITGVAGCIIVGAVSDRLKRRKLPLAVFATMNVLLVSSMIVLPPSAPRILYTTIWALQGISMSMWVLPYAMVTEVLPSTLSGSGLGMINFLGYAGSTIMTPVFGALIDSTGSYALSNQIVIATGMIVVFVYSTFVRETYPQEEGKDNLR